MPGIAVSQIVADCLGHCRESGNPSAGASNTLLLNEINEVYAEFCGDARLLNTGTLDIPMVYNQDLYAFDTNNLHILNCYYYQASGSIAYALIPTNSDASDYDIPTWRDPNISPSQPSYYFLEGDQIGVWPRPNITASGGYPKVTVFYDTYVTLTYASSLAPQVLSGKFLVYAVVARLFARFGKPDKVQMFKALAKEEKLKLIRLMNQRDIRDKAGTKYRLPRITRL